MHAIAVCYQERLFKRHIRTKIYTAYDSKVALKTLESNSSESKMKWNYKWTLKNFKATGNI